MFRNTCYTALLICACTSLVHAGGTFESKNVILHSWLDLNDFGNPGAGNDCWGYTSPSGREYALMGLYNKMTVVEITDPNNAIIIDSVSHSGSSWADIKVYQDVAYVANESGGGIDVVDLADVDSGIVTLVQRMTLGGVSSSHNIVVDEQSGFLYLAGGNNGGRLVAYDLSNPRYPTLAGSMSGGSGLHDAQVVTYTSGPYTGKQICFGFSAYAGVYIIDVTDKSNMSIMSTATYSGLSICHQGWLGDDGQYLYVNDEGDSNPETIVMDVSNLENPIVVNRFGWGANTIDHNLYIKDNILYEANYQSGIRIFDLNVDPVNPPMIGFFDTYPNGNSENFDGLWSCFPFFNSGTVIGSDIDRGLFVWSIGFPDPCDSPLESCAIDIDEDGAIGIGDLLAVIGEWGLSGDGTFRPNADVDGDCHVDVSDLLQIINAWGETCVITGACCLSDFSCMDLPENACTGTGYTYLGDNTTCSNITCPGLGDECNTAFNAIFGENAFETTTASPSSPEPDDSMCSGTYMEWDNSKDIWFEWTATFTASVRFTTCDSSSYDTSMAVYKGKCNNQVACNGDGSGDNGCQQWYSAITMNVSNGDTYYIRIGGWQGATGSGTLTIEYD